MECPILSKFRLQAFKQESILGGDGSLNKRSHL